mmetsp:Transcript_59795/g.146842  ORF Transcript_59795/g.146842 Transcript_59795/m.146842 type:complete len:80 (+) Transcript_59795:216-455(+)
MYLSRPNFVLLYIRRTFSVYCFALIAAICKSGYRKFNNHSLSLSLSLFDGKIQYGRKKKRKTPPPDDILARKAGRQHRQ